MGIQIQHTKLREQKLEAFVVHRFCEDVSKLEIGANKVHVNDFLLHLVFQKMIPQVKVIGTRMMNWVAGNGNCALGITIDGNVIE